MLNIRYFLQCVMQCFLMILQTVKTLISVTNSSSIVMLIWYSEKVPLFVRKDFNSFQYVFVASVKKSILAFLF